MEPSGMGSGLGMTGSMPGSLLFWMKLEASTMETIGLFSSPFYLFWWLVGDDD